MTCIPLSEINRMKNMIKDDKDPVVERFIDDVFYCLTFIKYIIEKQNHETERYAHKKLERYNIS